MNYYLYDILTTLATPLGAAYLAVNSDRKALLARFAAPEAVAAGKSPLWVHACSVGELSVAKPIVEALARRFPGDPIVLTVSTKTGYEMAQQAPGSANLRWFPFDQRGIVAKWFDCVRPAALILLETEIWPNVLREANRRCVPALVVNGRISDKHVVRYESHHRFFQSVFSRLSAVGAQHAVYAERFAKLGVNASDITVTGNIKFDNLITAVDDEKLTALRDSCSIPVSAPVIVFGSTRPGDEELAASCWRVWSKEFPAAILVVAPRHRARLNEALKPFTDPVLLRSEVTAGKRRSNERIIVVDTLGELVHFYALGTVAVIGGSFYPGVNGHNPLEPAALGVPTVFGPYMRNFIDPADVLVNADAAVQVDSPERLCESVSTLLRDPARRAELATAARSAIAANTGALSRTVDLIATVVNDRERP